jgi:hypothetical protein
VHAFLLLLLCCFLRQIVNNLKSLPAMLLDILLHEESVECLCFVAGLLQQNKGIPGAWAAITTSEVVMAAHAPWIQLSV